MESYKYFRVVVEDNKLVLTTDKNNSFDRDDFLEEFTTYLFLNWFDQRCSLVYVLIREMIKNVFDHGTGESTLVLTKNGSNYIFDFVDHNPEIVSFEKCCSIKRGKSWVQKSDSNRNFGMALITSLGKEEGVTLVVDDTEGGINYSGTFSR